MEYLRLIIIFWMIGFIPSYLILTICVAMEKKSPGMPVFAIGVVASWFTVSLFLYHLIRSVIETSIKKFNLNKMSNSDMIKQTIEDYWVPATKYGEQFDPDPKLPIPGSKLCAKYYHTNCINCPIHKAKFGCTQVGFFLKYQDSEHGYVRKRSAMILGKIFSDVFNEEWQKER